MCGQKAALTKAFTSEYPMTLLYFPLNSLTPLFSSQGNKSLSLLLKRPHVSCVPFYIDHRSVLCSKLSSNPFMCSAFRSVARETWRGENKFTEQTAKLAADRELGLMFPFIPRSFLPHILLHLFMCVGVLLYPPGNSLRPALLLSYFNELAS